jgi:hypothetical protein
LQILSPQKPGQSPGQLVVVSVSAQTRSPQRTGVQSTAHEPGVSVPVQSPSPHLLQSGEQDVGVSLAEHVRSPQKPQSSGQMNCSCEPQNLSPQKVQSNGQFCEVSGARHTPLPQLLKQSEGHVDGSP